jgi:hypothetical protein
MDGEPVKVLATLQDFGSMARGADRVAVAADRLVAVIERLEAPTKCALAVLAVAVVSMAATRWYEALYRPPKVK